MHHPLEVTVRKQGTEIVMDLMGDIDLISVKILAGPFAEVVQAIITDATLDTLTLDLRQVDFVDSAGLGLLVNTCKRLKPLSKQLQVVTCAGRQPERALRLGRCETIMTLKHDFDE